MSTVTSVCGKPSLRPVYAKLSPPEASYAKPSVRRSMHSSSRYAGSKRARKVLRLTLPPPVSRSTSTFSILHLLHSRMNFAAKGPSAQEVLRTLSEGLQPDVTQPSAKPTAASATSSLLRKPTTPSLLRQAYPTPVPTPTLHHAKAYANSGHPYPSPIPPQRPRAARYQQPTTNRPHDTTLHTTPRLARQALQL